MKGSFSTVWDVYRGRGRSKQANLKSEICRLDLSVGVEFSISEQLLLCTEKGFQGGHVLKARRLLYHSSLGRE